MCKCCKEEMTDNEREQYIRQTEALNNEMGFGLIIVVLLVLGFLVFG